MTSPAVLGSSPGRPKDPGKHAAILAAARKLFFEQGPTGVTIEAVAAAAAVSRMTVYGHFGDKETLFEAVISQQASEVGRALSKLSENGVAGDVSTSSGLRRGLIAFGIDLTAFLLRPDVQAFNRLMEGAAGSHPKLARIWADSGPRAVFRILTYQLGQASDAGIIAAPEPAKAARHLIGLFKSIETAASAAGMAPPPAPPEIERHVAECVEVFLRGYSTVWASTLSPEGPQSRPPAKTGRKPR